MENFKITLEKSENFLTAFGVSEERATAIGNIVADIMEDKSIDSLSELIEKSVNAAAANQNEAIYIAFTLGKYVGHSDAMEGLLESMVSGLSKNEDDMLIDALTKNKPTAQA